RTTGASGTRARVGSIIAGVVFLLAGVRWYFAGVLIVATSVFLLAVALSSPERRLASLGAAAALFLLMLQSLVLSAGSQVPAGSMVAAVDHVRLGFEQTPANTAIWSSGATVARMVPPERLAAADETKIRRMLGEQAAAWNRYDAAHAMSGYWRSPEF